MRQQRYLLETQIRKAARFGRVSNGLDAENIKCAAIRWYQRNKISFDCKQIKCQTTHIQKETPMKETLYTIPLTDAFLANDECPFCYIERNVEQYLLDLVLGSGSSYM